MTTAIFAQLAANSFVFVALKAVQQLNVMHDEVYWIAPVSALLAIAEVSLLLATVITGWWSWVPMCVGGSLGCLGAMAFHRRMRARKVQCEKV